MTKTLPIIFFGSSDFSVYVLKEFLKKYKPILVLTLKGKPQGRGLKIEPNIVYSFCLKEKLNVIEFDEPRKSADINAERRGQKTQNNADLNDEERGKFTRNHTENESLYNSALFGLNSGNQFGNNSDKYLISVDPHNTSLHSSTNKTGWEKFKKDIEKIKPITGIVASFGKIIKKEIIDMFPNGIINVHPSLLPKYRGPNPIREVILNGEKETGTTLFLVDELIDHGPIIKQEKINLTGKENYIELEQILGRLGGKMLNEILEDYLKYADLRGLNTRINADNRNDADLRGTKYADKRRKHNKDSRRFADNNIRDDSRENSRQFALNNIRDNSRIIKLIPQDENLATYTKKITKQDGLLSFNDGYEIWDRKIRALNPWPGTYVYLEDRSKNLESRRILKIFSITKLEEKNLPKDILKKNIGEFFNLRNDLGLRIKDSFIILQEVQLEGRKRMSGREFLNGFRKLININ
jgi:methionyl-tRNA formyltransferase